MNYLEQFADETVHFSPFAFSNTGVIKSQTLLKIDTYNLMTVPLQLGMKRGILIGSFSKDEISFFQRFVGGVASLSLGVQRPDEREPIKIFSRCQVSTVGQMKGKEGIGLVAIDWKPMPPDLAEILGNYLLLLQRLTVEYGDFKDRSVSINPAAAKQLGYNNFAVLKNGAEQHKVALFSLAANRVEFLMPMTTPEQKAGEAVSFDLFFLKYRFTVAGEIESSVRLPTGVQRCKATLAFSPELLHILEEYFVAHR